MNLKNCPCEKCLVKVQCRSKIIRTDRCEYIDGDVDEKKYLLFDYLNKCQMVRNYFYLEYNSEGSITYQSDFSDRIRMFCKIHGVPGNKYVWYRNELRIY